MSSILNGSTDGAYEQFSPFIRRESLDAPSVAEQFDGASEPAELELEDESSPFSTEFEDAPAADAVARRDAREETSAFEHAFEAGELELEDGEDSVSRHHQDAIVSEAALGVGELEEPSAESEFFIEHEELEGEPAIDTTSVQAFADSISRQWAARVTSKPNRSAQWFASDHADTLAAARARWGNGYGKGDQTESAVTRAWMISRVEEMKYAVGSPGVALLGRFEPPSERPTLIHHRLVEEDPPAPVAPIVGQFAEQLRNSYKPYMRLGNYPRHGGGSFAGRGYSLDMNIRGVDDRGFFPVAAAIEFLGAVDKAANAVGLDWRVLYNDFTVADAVNRRLGRRHVTFIGQPFRKDGKIVGLNWHGPAPLILHFHLDLAARASVAVQPSSPVGSGATAMGADVVRFIQRVLNKTQGERLEVDGVLGPVTRGALERFRGQYNLGRGTAIDQATLIALAQRALEELALQSLFAEAGVRDQVFDEALMRFKSRNSLPASPELDSATVSALGNALGARAPTSASQTSTPNIAPPVTGVGLPRLGADLAVPSDPSAFRKFRLTTYHVADQVDFPMSGNSVPILDQHGNKLAEGSAAFFANLSLEGTGRLLDGRLINVVGKKTTAAVSHEQYAAVLEYHRQAYARRDEKRRKNHQPPTPFGYSGIFVRGDRVVRALAFHEVPKASQGIGYGMIRGIPYIPFRTLAADIGLTDRAEKAWKGKGGVVPPGTHVYIKEYAGRPLPDGTTHDGWFVVNDTGGGIFGVHFDVFVGSQQQRKAAGNLPEVGTVWFPGIENRVPSNYTNGLNG